MDNMKKITAYVTSSGAIFADLAEAEKQAAIEALENFGSGFCIKIKLKYHPKFKNDIYVICMENEELREMWVKSFSMVYILLKVIGYVING
jgi:hypothetical protein